MGSSSNQNYWTLDEESERYFSDAYHQRRHLVIVNTSSSNRAEAIDILKSCGAIVEDRASHLYESEFSRSRSLGLSDQGLDQRQVLRLREEELVARTENVQAGEVRVRKEVVTETKTIEVPVSHEEVVIERRSLSGQEVASTPGSLSASSMNEREEIRVPVSEEQVIVEKRVVPREEVIITKAKVQETEQVSEDVKREEVEIEKEGHIAMRDKKDKDLKDRDIDRDRPAGQRPYL
jgi:uncharacterized protein (TIGR02271 family)